MKAKQDQEYQPALLDAILLAILIIVLESAMIYCVIWVTLQWPDLLPK